MKTALNIVYEFSVEYWSNSEDNFAYSSRENTLFFILKDLNLIYSYELFFWNPKFVLKTLNTFREL